MTEQEKRAHRCCFTGHRPEKLSLPESEVKAELEKEIRLAIADGINVFIVGMAPGVDIWAAEVILELREKEELPLKLIAASPHPGFENRWSIEGQKRYASIMSKADFIKEVCTHYSRGCYQIRNEWMDYDFEEEFFPQFIANRDMMIKMMNDLPIHGGE